MSAHPLRFGAAWLLLAFCGGLWLVLFLAQAKAGFHSHHVYTHKRATQKCGKVGCAQVGDTVTFTIHGRVVSVSEPQPGVVCVQTGSSRQAGQVCEPK